MTTGPGTPPMSPAAETSRENFPLMSTAHAPPEVPALPSGSRPAFYPVLAENGGTP